MFDFEEKIEKEVECRLEDNDVQFNKVMHEIYKE
jgi:hypothetical protein